MKRNRKTFLFGTAIIALVVLMLWLALSRKPLATSNIMSASVQARKEPAAPTVVVARPQNVPELVLAVAPKTTPEVQVTTLPTPSPTSRPYIRMQINTDGTPPQTFLKVLRHVVRLG